MIDKRVKAIKMFLKNPANSETLQYSLSFISSCVIFLNNDKRFYAIRKALFVRKKKKIEISLFNHV